MAHEQTHARQGAGKQAGIASHTGLAMIVVMTGVLITAVDTTIVVLALPEIERSLRSQSMAVVDEIRWIPGVGHDRELDWLLNMDDWMISKKRYWGLALPIYDCPACGRVDVISGRDELRLPELLDIA